MRNILKKNGEIMPIIAWCNKNSGFIETIGLILPIAGSFLYFLSKGAFNQISGKVKNEFINSQTNLLDRNVKLKRKMQEDLYRKNGPSEYAPHIPQEKLPDHAKFIDSKWYSLNIADKTIFALNEDNYGVPESLHMISPVDFYNHGLVVQFDFISARIDKHGNFFFPKNYAKEYKGFKKLEVRSFGYIPFKHIVSYEEYNEHQGGHPILYCKYSGIKLALETPYEKVEYKKNIQNTKWHFLPELDNELLFKDTFWGWTKYRMKRIFQKI